MGERARFFFDQSLSDLTSGFNLRSRVSEVYLPVSLYKSILKVYGHADDMHRQILSVLEDGEHKLIMEEGRDFFKLPSNTCLHKELGDLRQALDSFDPYRVSFYKDGRVRISDRQMDGFLKVLSHGYDVVHASFEMFRKTDYLKYFRHLRDVRHVPYAGPTSLQEIVSLYFGIARVCTEQRNYYRDIIEERHNKLEKKVEEAMALGGPVIELSPRGGLALQSTPAPR